MSAKYCLFCKNIFAWFETKFDVQKSHFSESMSRNLQIKNNFQITIFFSIFIFATFLDETWNNRTSRKKLSICFELFVIHTNGILARRMKINLQISTNSFHILMFPILFNTRHFKFSKTTQRANQFEWSKTNFNSELTHNDFLRVALMLLMIWKSTFLVKLLKSYWKFGWKLIITFHLHSVDWTEKQKNYRLIFLPFPMGNREK